MKVRWLLFILLGALVGVESGQQAYEPAKLRTSQLSPLLRLMCDELRKRTADKSGKSLASARLKTGTTLVGSAQNGQSGQTKKANDFSMLQRVFQKKIKSLMLNWRRKKLPHQYVEDSQSESSIHFIQLPPAPYSYVNGLGYISQPPIFAASSLAAVAADSASQHRKDVNPMIRLPVEFVSNGKPSSVYRWPEQPSVTPPAQRRPKPQLHNCIDCNDEKKRGKPKQDSAVIKLKQGPYFFNGKPHDVVAVEIKRLP